MLHGSFLKLRQLFFIDINMFHHDVNVGAMRIPAFGFSQLVQSILSANLFDESATATVENRGYHRLVVSGISRLDSGLLRLSVCDLGSNKLGQCLKGRILCTSIPVVAAIDGCFALLSVIVGRFREDVVTQIHIVTGRRVPLILLEPIGVQSCLLGCGGVGHGLCGANKLLVCHYTVTNCIGILFVMPLYYAVGGGACTLFPIILDAVGALFQIWSLIRTVFSLFGFREFAWFLGKFAVFSG
jgi:hypothetical protein